MAEITRKSVLLECLSIMREEQRICSKGYNSLEPAKGMEEAWEQGRQKIKILQEIIQALDSEPVLRAMANWQKEEMPPKNINSEFRIQNSELTAAAGGDILYEFDAVTGGYRVLKVSPDLKALMTELQTNRQENRMDTEDGTMELR